MSKVPPPVLGFNNNVRHRGRIFHIQTEDSGVKFARIVTHLFADGGRIIKTARTDYGEHLEQGDAYRVGQRVHGRIVDRDETDVAVTNERDELGHVILSKEPSARTPFEERA